ncbi:ACT domain-containing protein [Pseudohongiella sp. SYSU M77423]|uniref:ACT domain-containing protein n=1 Tax=Pseudohongiella sp. SYSU M77423 TaxID=3042312 RepID=UPI00247FEBDB|nr:ACT domain-containing protein [Pseudohongiella sp. SYSU M77423]MDH7943369.1 ACT domain-containing protein [Pseudohongiella sp. SYSU M77423]
MQAQSSSGQQQGVADLDDLLRSLQPCLTDSEFVFCCVPGSLDDYIRLEPLATIREEEGLTLVLPLSVAERERLGFNGVFRQITLSVHSSLEAVGLTAAVSRLLADHGIAANILAGYYHDHIFVPRDKADVALSLLQRI